MSEIKDVLFRGYEKNNSALVQLLGLCPLLAVTSTATNALGLGLATTLVLTLTNLTILTLRHWTPRPNPHSHLRDDHTPRWSALYRCSINAYAFGLSESYGIFIPLIVTNCIVVGRAEAFAAKKGPALSALDGFSIGMGATCAMFVLGSLREIIGNGTLFDGADALLGSWAKIVARGNFPHRLPFPAGDALPPGAFIAWD
ncbi:Rnf-Nqr domain containing protein [Escherichia coli]